MSNALPSEPAAVSRETSDELVISYSVWRGERLPDPRTTRRSQVARRLQEIVEVEGPVTTDRAYKVFIRGAGSTRVTAPVEEALDTAVRLLRSEIETMEFSVVGGPVQTVLRLPNQPTVLVREIGPREIYEVPLDEIAALMVNALTTHRAIPGESIKRFVLDTHGLVRLTPRVNRFLETAWRLVEDSQL